MNSGHARWFFWLMLASAASVCRGQDWSIPKDAPLLTRWTAEVRPDSVLPEYPRPYRGPKPGQPAAPADLAQGYWVGAAVADSIGGPYTKQPQVFLGGHIATFTGPDGKEWFAYRGESGGKAQGRLCIDPIQFNDDGSVKPLAPSIGPAKPN